MQILHLEAGTPFKMGKGQNWRVVHPDMGAKQLTLNHGVHAPGQEFTQHFHDNSEDMIVVLEGGSSVRQGDVYTPVSAREAIFVPVGEVHGTVNDTGKMARLISFQSPPDMALYRGERDHAPNQIPKPKHGHQSAVQVVDMARSGPVFGKSGDWRCVISPERGSKHISLEYIRLSSGEGFEHEQGAAEAIYVLVDGKAEVKARRQTWNLAAKDVMFLKPEESCSISPVIGGQLLTLLHCRAVGG
ncbi:MAG: cupin domain-containing protein [Candidatus Poribacteria bacterium]|nr:cupin domain-containing protein [Candidatus Poribacteria bacterium]